MRNKKSGVRNEKNQGSGIRNEEAEIRNQKSEIRTRIREPIIKESLLTSIFCPQNIII